MRLADFANDPAPHQFNGPAQPSLGGTLIAHLRDHLAVARGGLAHDPRFVDRARQRLLTINVFAQFHRRHCGDGVRVVGSRDQHGIDPLFHLIEHLAEILIAPRRRMFLINVARPRGIHVAERDEVVAHAMKGIETTPALTADADAGNVQFAVGLVGEGQLAVAENQKSGPERRRFGKEAAALNQRFHRINGFAGWQWF